MITDNVKRVQSEYVDIGYTLGMSDRTIIRRIILPASAPAVWDTLRITLGWAWTYVIVAALRKFPAPPAPSPHSHGHRRWGWLAAVGMMLTATTGWLFYWLAFVA